MNKLSFFKSAKAWLILSSFYFYAQASPWFLLYFIGILLFNYLLGTALIRIKKKGIRNVLLLIGLLTDIGLLCHYKYLDFLIANTNRLFSRQMPLKNLLMPVGLSYFTFQLIAYLVDCHRGKAKEYGILDYFLFASFFPQLLIGPIARHNEIIPQFSDEKQPYFNADNFQRGLFIFSIGCGKKVLLASPLLLFNSALFGNESNYSPHVLWIALFTNLFALYFDFSGYTDMAIGLGCFFNIKLAENFNSPYKARNFQDYWRRWHISLTRFLGDYVFNLFYKPGKGTAWFCIATLITFLVSGFWHGAGWNYILWGLLHGMVVCLTALVALSLPRKYLMSKLLARVLTLVGLALAGVLYICNGVSHYLRVVKGLFHFGVYAGKDIGQELLFFCGSNFWALMLLAVSVGICFYAKNTKELAKYCLTNPRYPLFAAILLSLSLFAMGTTSEFVYFRF